MLELLQTYGVFFLIGEYPHGPLGGLSMTIVMAAMALLLAFLLGMLFGICQLSPFKAVRIPVLAFLFFIRSMPLLMIIFWAYFLIPVLLGTTVSQFTTVLVSLVIFQGTYISFIVAAGVQSLNKGQMETARSLGLPYWQAMVYVILPQVLRNMLPSLVGEFVATIKLTSLGYVIGLSELTRVAEQVNAITITKPAEVYALLALTYFVICFTITRFSYWLERRLSGGASRAAVSRRRLAWILPSLFRGATIGSK